MPNKTVKFLVDGMSCSGCSSKIQKSLQEINGVVSAHVELKSREVFITYNSSLTSLDIMYVIVESLGFDIVSQ